MLLLYTIEDRTVQGLFELSSPRPAERFDSPTEQGYTSIHLWQVAKEGFRRGNRVFDRSKYPACHQRLPSIHAIPLYLKQGRTI